MSEQEKINVNHSIDAYLRLSHEVQALRLENERLKKKLSRLKDKTLKLAFSRKRAGNPPPSGGG